MNSREKIFIGIALGSLVITGATIGLSLKYRQTQADVAQPVPSNSPTTGDNTNNPSGSQITIPLVNGWNLMNVPLNFLDLTTAEQVFGNGISGMYTLRDGEWQAVGSGERVTPSTGYLVKMTAATSLHIDRAKTTDTQSPYTENLDSGYGIATNPFNEVTTLPTITIKNKKYSTKETIDNKFIRLYRWNTGLQKFEKLTGEELLKKFEAILVQTNEPLTLTFIQ